jgi:hypothetical protein
MKERGILFSAPMVRALLAGTKTQTRRALKRQPWASCSIEEGGDGESPFVYSSLHGAGPGHEVEEERTPCRCPYGVPGDRLWVRETWAFERNAIGSAREEEGPFVYRATDSEQRRLCDRWRPSIHMPRWASRILLEIVSVRVERLQDIRAADARAEGLHRYPYDWRDSEFPLDDVAYEPFEGFGTRYSCASQAYCALWESINGAGSWAANPWVWSVEFRRIE